MADTVPDDAISETAPEPSPETLPDAAPPPPNAADVVAGLAAVRHQIAQAAEDAERDPATVALVAVSKTIPAAGILPALAAGQRLFGENYVQESKAKWPALRERYPDVELHLVGPLQSNKARASTGSPSRRLWPRRSRGWAARRSS
jgi:hypothetical protein